MTERFASDILGTTITLTIMGFLMCLQTLQQYMPICIANTVSLPLWPLGAPQTGGEKI
jgi:hypothetical protein